MTAFAENLARMQERIAAACEHAGRRPEEITLVAVTKKQTAETVANAVAAGMKDVGENYVQEANEKRGLFPEMQSARWHLLGHLQSNKARTAVEIFDLIQSVDSVSLARTLGRHAGAAGKMQDALLQVHLGDEESKSGFAPELVMEAAAEMANIPSLELRGLMGIAPAGVDARPYFAQLRRLFDALPFSQRQILSMGMTGDFEVAIEEGATMIRIGTALFGPRTK